MPNRKSANPLEDLFAETLKDVYFAEKQILRALPKMAKEATTPELKTAFETQRDETEGQIERLNQVFELMGKPARGKTCEAIVGIIDEAKENMEDFSGSQALDPALVASAQTVEHYEIARYGALKAEAKELGHDDAAQLLDETLQEEIKTDKLLTMIAGQSLNRTPRRDGGGFSCQLRRRQFAVRLERSPGGAWRSLASSSIGGFVAERRMQSAMTVTARLRRQARLYKYFGAWSQTTSAAPKKEI